MAQGCVHQLAVTRTWHAFLPLRNLASLDGAEQIGDRKGKCVCKGEDGVEPWRRLTKFGAIDQLSVDSGLLGQSLLAQTSLLSEVAESAPEGSAPAVRLGC